MKRDSERMTVRKNVALLKAATVGLIGDGVKTITHAELQNRVTAQASRLGIFPPSWPAIVDAARYMGWIILTHHIELPLPPMRAPRPVAVAPSISRNTAFHATWESLQRSLGILLTHAHTACTTEVRAEYADAVRHARAELNRLETMSAGIR